MECEGSVVLVGSPRLVAVGGSDDCVQILQRKEPKVSSTTRPITPASILNYCKLKHLIALATCVNVEIS